MKKPILACLSAFLLVSLTACGAAGPETRQGSGLRNTGSTVSQILESAASTGAPANAVTPESMTEIAVTPPAPAQTAAEAPEDSGIDIDLTKLNSTMVYSEVFSMMAEPEAFLGKTVRLAGYCTSSYYEPTGTIYYAVIIPDATACCAQGIEYTLTDGAPYPADDSEIIITGTFELYEELGIEYCRLGNAVIGA